MEVRTREIPPEQEFIPKNKKFEHILSWSAILMFGFFITIIVPYYLYIGTQNFQGAYILGSIIFYIYSIVIIGLIKGGIPKISLKQFFFSFFIGPWLLWVGIISFIMISYSNKGIYGIFSSSNIIIGCLIALRILYFLGDIIIKLISGKLPSSILSKSIFYEDESLADNIEMSASKNLEQSMKYYNKEQLKSNFQNYIFGKDIKIALISSYIFFLFFYMTLLVSIHLLGVSFYISFFTTFICTLFSMRNFFSFFIKKNKIALSSFSIHPETYAWKDTNTLYFK